MILKEFSYVRCDEVDAAVAALVEHGDDARLVAGGTVVVPLMKHDLLRPGVLVGLDGADGLRGARRDGDSVRVGALTTHREVTRSAEVRAAAPLLAEACGRVASPVIRSMGTLGGNLCYGESASDPSPVLLLLDARAHVTGPDGARVVPVRDFFVGFYETVLGAAEIVTEVEVGPLPPGTRASYTKWTPRAREDKPLIGLAAAVTPGADGPAVRLAVGGVDERPRFLAAASAAATGSDFGDAAIAAAADAAAEEVDPIEDLQGTPEYRRAMLAVWVRRALTALREQGGS